MKKVFCEQCNYIHYNGDNHEWECWSPLNHSIKEQRRPTWFSENIVVNHEFRQHPSELNDGNMCEFYKGLREPENDR